MAVTDEQIEEKKSRNAEKKDQIAELKRQISSSEAEGDNQIKAADLDREDAKLDAEIARLTAAADGINSGGQTEAAKPATNAPSGDQRNPTVFGVGTADDDEDKE